MLERPSGRSAEIPPVSWYTRQQKARATIMKPNTKSTLINHDNSPQATTTTNLVLTAALVGSLCDPVSQVSVPAGASDLGTGDKGGRGRIWNCPNTNLPDKHLAPRTSSDLPPPRHLRCAAIAGLFFSSGVCCK